MTKEKTVFIELLRIIACFFVIVNHTNSMIFLETAPPALWFVSLFYFFVSKPAVPIFVMIAGYVMLDRQDSYRKTFQRFFRILSCLLVFSGMYYISERLSGNVESFGFKDFMVRIVEKPITNAYWWMYLYMGILLMLPFLQKLAAHMEKKDFHVFFLISGGFFSVLPIILHYMQELTLTTWFRLPLFNSYICMLFLGYYIKRYGVVSKKWRRISVGMFFFMCVLNVVFTYGEYKKVPEDWTVYLFFDEREFFPILLASVCLFYIVFTLPLKGRITGWIRAMGSLTFGIYLVADFFIVKLAGIYRSLVTAGMYPMAAMLFYELAVFAASAFAAFLLKKLPLFRKLI